jgi:hypothetical protein
MGRDRAHKYPGEAAAPEEPPNSIEALEKIRNLDHVDRDDERVRQERRRVSSQRNGRAERKTRNLQRSCNEWEGARELKMSNVLFRNGISGAEGRDRTGDLTITNRLLYQLSYLGFFL